MVADYLDGIIQAPPDAILGIAQAFRESNVPEKINLAVGAYRDERGNPFVLPSVRQAEHRLLQRDENKEYAPIDGLPVFKRRALEFAYGRNVALADGRIAGVQTLSGTGACRIAGEVYVAHARGTHMQLHADACTLRPDGRQMEQDALRRSVILVTYSASTRGASPPCVAPIGALASFMLSSCLRASSCTFRIRLGETVRDLLMAVHMHMHMHMQQDMQ